MSILILEVAALESKYDQEHSDNLWEFQRRQELIFRLKRSKVWVLLTTLTLNACSQFSKSRRSSNDRKGSEKEVGMNERVSMFTGDLCRPLKLLTTGYSLLATYS
jgi:hypothetical protein